MPKFKYLFLLLIITLATGCASTSHFQAYDGLTLPDNQQARVVSHKEKGVWKNVWAGVYVQTRITCVDGESTVGFWDVPSEILLKPGFHSFTVAFTGGPWGGQTRMWLVAEAGHIYDAKYEMSKMGLFKMWFEDRMTGEIVGGVPGGEPPGTKKTKGCE